MTHIRSYAPSYNNYCCLFLQITHYNIEYGKNMVVPVTEIDPDNLEFTIEDLTPDTLYR